MLDHLTQHDVAPLQCTFRVEHRIVVTGTFEHADQGGAFQQVQRVGRFVKVSTGRHFNTVSVVQKRHGVEVGLQDFVLAVHSLNFQRGNSFLEFAVQRRCAANIFGVKITCQLLRDGRAALLVTRHRVQGSGKRAPEIYAVVRIKTVVFGSHQCIDHVG